MRHFDKQQQVVRLSNREIDADDFEAIASALSKVKIERRKYIKMYTGREAEEPTKRRRLQLVKKVDEVVRSAKAKLIIDSFIGYLTGGAEGAGGLIEDIARDIAITGTGFIYLSNGEWLRHEPDQAVAVDLGGWKCTAFASYLEDDRIISLHDGKGWVVYSCKDSKIASVTPTALEPHAFNLSANKYSLGILEPIADMLSAYDRVLGDKVAEVDYFKDSYLWVDGVNLGNEKQAQNVKDSRILNTFNQEGVKVEFLQKPNADQTQENLLNRLDNLIEEASQVVNLSDNKYSEQSGVALKYRLLSMDNLAKGYDSALKTLANLLGLDIEFKRNLPTNRKDEIEQVVALDGHISDETKLNLLSFVSDPAEELKRMRAEDGQDDI